jgi:hypothetical protein
MRYRRPRRNIDPWIPAWWKTVLKMWEIGQATPQVIAHRTARMRAAGLFPNMADRKEFSRMGQEKIEALTESWSAMAMQTYRINMELTSIAAQQWWNAWVTLPQLMAAPSKSGFAKAQSALTRVGVSPSSSKRLASSFARTVAKGIAPVHKRVTANARRLGRAKSR